jgi:hypothetical protein
MNAQYEEETFASLIFSSTSARILNHDSISVASFSRLVKMKL